MSVLFSHNKPQKARSVKKNVIIVVAGILVLCGIILGLHQTGVIDVPFLPDKVEDRDENGISYGPPTEEEKSETEAYKDSLGDQQSNQSVDRQSSPGGQVTPIISSWGQNATGNVEVAGFVPGILESGGTCTASLEKAGQTVNSPPQPATPNAQNVSCGFITIERARLSTGKWNVSLSYTSSTSRGTSQALTLEVQ